MADLPSGTVTFLFTDIEGSARLWAQNPAQMKIALARHDALMRAAIARNDGYVFTAAGDAFCAAFHSAPAALATALDAQHALAIEPWPAPTPIKVRMALHTGAAEVRDNDYFGQPLNRVARLLSAGHGGQVLLSQTTRDLLADEPDTACLDLGVHLIKDFPEPQCLFQLVDAELPSDFRKGQ